MTDLGVMTTHDPDTHVGVIEIRRGPHNFFDLGVLTAVADAAEALGDEGARCLVLCSEGKNFCAGADFGGGNRSGGASDGDLHVYDIAYRLFAQPIPVVAAVQGAAIGGGLGLAMSADFRVAAPGSRFAANFALLGFHQGFALSVTLPDVVGQQAALDLLYTGRRIDGTAAHAIGLCDDLVDETDLRDAAVARAAEIARSAPLAVRSIRATMRGALAERAREAMAHERAEQERLQRTADFAEGVAAVRDRRVADFTGS